MFLEHALSELKDRVGLIKTGLLPVSSHGDQRVERLVSERGQDDGEEESVDGVAVEVVLGHIPSQLKLMAK